MYWQPAAARGEASKSLMLLLCDRNGMTKPRKYGKHRVQVGRAESSARRFAETTARTE